MPYAEIEGIAFDDTASGEDGHIVFRTETGSTMTEQMRITQSAVGIGTSTPSQKFEVNGGATSTYMKIVGQNRTGYIGQDSVGMAVYQESNQKMYFATNNITRMTIAAGGDVGIGTGSPAKTLHIKKDAGHFRISSADYDLISMGPRGDSGSNLDKAAFNMMASDGSSKVYFDTAGDSYINGGDLGIGTASPSTKLDVVGTITAGANSYMSMQDNEVTTSSGHLKVHSADDVNLDAHSGVTNFQYRGTETFRIAAGASTPVVLQPKASGFDLAMSAQDGTEVLRLDSANKRIGIGTASPNAKLEVLSTSNPQIRANYNGSHYLDIYASNGTGYIKSDGRFRVSSSTGRYIFHGNANSTGRAEMFLSAGGDIANKRMSSFAYILRGYEGKDGAGIYFGNTVSGSNNEGSTNAGGREGTQWYAGLNYAGGGPTDEWILSTDYRTTSGSGADGYTPVITAQKTNTYGQQGRVGINNKNPASTFDIRQQTGGVHGLIVDTDYSNGDQIRVLKDGNTNLLGKVTFDGTNMVVGAWGSGGGIRFWNHGEGMRLTGNKLGIGTTAPPAKLSIQGDGSTTSNIQLSSDGSNWSQIYQDTNDDLVVDVDGGSNFWVRRGGNNVARFSSTIFYYDTDTLYANGTTNKVGIGTNSPNEKLTVEGVLSLDETSAPSATSGYGKIYVKSSDSKLYFMNDSGTETDLTAGGGGSVSFGSDNQIPFTNSGGDDFDYSANLTFDGSTLIADADIRLLDGEKGLFGTDSNFQIYGSAGATKYITTLSEQLLIWNQDSSSAPIKIQATDTSNGIQFNIAGTEMGRFTSTGLGIGTSSPSEIFYVEHSNNTVGKFKSTDNRGLIQVSDDDTTVSIVAEGSTASIGQTSQLATTNINIDTDGKLGIGITDPVRHLDVNSATTDIVGRFTSSDNRATIQLSDDDTDRYINTENSAISLGPNNSLHSNNLNIVGSPVKVGMGTTSPSDMLHIKGASDVDIRLEDSDATGMGNMDTMIRGFRQSTEAWFLGTESGAGTLKLGITSGHTSDVAIHSAGSERLRVTDTGKVGIGTTAPDTSLHVLGAVTSSPTKMITTKSEQLNPGTVTTVNMSEDTFQYIAETENGGIVDLVLPGAPAVGETYRVVWETRQYFSSGGGFPSIVRLSRPINNMEINQTAATFTLKSNSSNSIFQGMAEIVCIDDGASSNVVKYVVQNTQV